MLFIPIDMQYNATANFFLYGVHLSYTLKNKINYNKNIRKQCFQL